MSVIAYRNGVLAADQLVTQHSVRLGLAQKVFKLPDGTLVGGVGRLDALVPFVAWVAKNAWKYEGHEARYQCIGDLQAIVIAADGQVYNIAFDEDDSTAAMYQITAGFVAIGSGSDLAVGAMSMGASAEQAVAVAIANHVECGGNAVSVKLDSVIAAETAAAEAAAKAEALAATEGTAVAHVARVANDDTAVEDAHDGAVH